MVGGHSRQRTALVLTVLDEAATLDALLASVAEQRRAPDEIVVVDGGSSDGTLARLDEWAARLPVKILSAPGANISRGRNLAIAATSADVLAVTDAGVRLDPDWLACLCAALTPEIDVVSGFFRADPQSTFERALGATTLPDLTDVRSERFLPSSRSVMFRRSAWERAGGYPEWLDYCEDLVFDLALRRTGARFAFQPRATVWFRPRPNFRAFFRQYYRYARGDGKADLWRRRHAIRYGTYLVALALLLKRPRWIWLLVPGLVAYTRRPYQRLDLDGLPASQALRSVALVPVIRLVGDVAKMLGYPVGVWWRLGR